MYFLIEHETAEDLGELVGGYFDIDLYFMDMLECHLAILEDDTPSKDFADNLFETLDLVPEGDLVELNKDSFKLAIERLQEPKYIDKYIKEANENTIKTFTSNGTTKIYK